VYQQPKVIIVEDYDGVTTYDKRGILTIANQLSACASVDCLHTVHFSCHKPSEHAATKIYWIHLPLNLYGHYAPVRWRKSLPGNESV